MSERTVKNERWRNVFDSIRVHAIKYKMRNTLIALDVAVKCHEGGERDGGEPYIIHPLMVAKTLILLKLEEELANWFPHMSKEEIKYQCDILYAAAILHDVIEDTDIKQKQLRERGLEKEVVDTILILTKKTKGQTKKVEPEIYFKRILMNWKATLIKIADRQNNCSTMQVFEEPRMKKYIYETIEWFYPLCGEAKFLYPEVSNAITIMKNSIIAIVEAIATLINMQDVIVDEEQSFNKIFRFIEEYSRNQMPNTHKALYIARSLYSGQVRSSGDPFIIHPLRVCSYLISIGIDDDILCAAMLLHEIPKKCSEITDGWELIETHNIDEEVIDLIFKIPKTKTSLDEYYEELQKDWKTIIGRLSNRVNTCTGLVNLSYEAKKEYITETREYLVPMCEYAVKRYPQFVNQIDIMENHISTICNIVEVVVKKQSTLNEEPS